jgi:hypothetical protein
LEEHLESLRVETGERGQAADNRSEEGKRPFRKELGEPLFVPFDPDRAAARNPQ